MTKAGSIRVFFPFRAIVIMVRSHALFTNFFVAWLNLPLNLTIRVKKSKKYRSGGKKIIDRTDF